jgi:HSP20 family protein
MPEEKFDPMKEFASIRDSLGKAVEQGMKNLRAGVYPAVDVYETDSAVVLRTAAMAGLDAASIEVSMENGVLLLKGVTHADEDIPEDTVYVLRERRFGEFTREVRIPRAVKPEAAQAKLTKGGVLTITLPKVADSSARVIDVTPAE